MTITHAGLADRTIRVDRLKDAMRQRLLDVIATVWSCLALIHR